jgi:hypothetical protein
MRFSATPTGSRLDYTIVFAGKVPGLGPLVRVMLTRSIRQALRDYATRSPLAAA